MELWDVYDENRQPTGRFHKRGEAMQPGDYHLVVSIWIKNSAGEYLIQKRSPEKPFHPGKWECAAAGAAQAGDDSLTAAFRETKEEIGVDLAPDALRLINTHTGKSFLMDVWYTELDVDADSLVLQEEEVSAVRWASADEIRDLTASGEFICWYADKKIPELPW
jgi:isopentenyldiphosphate isomerase